MTTYTKNRYRLSNILDDSRIKAAKLRIEKALNKPLLFKENK